MSSPLPIARETPQARVLIVDDSLVARTALARLAEADGRFVVVAAVPGADAALAFLGSHSVDVILLDLQMPGTSGIVALPALIAAARGARVLIVSGTAEAGARVTIEALALGAADTLVKPEPGKLAGRFGETLRQKIAVLAAPRPQGRTEESVSVPRVTAFDAIAIGASTGGIHALSSLLGA